MKIHDQVAIVDFGDEACGFVGDVVELDEATALVYIDDLSATYRYARHQLKVIDGE